MSGKLKPNFTPVPNVIFDKVLRTLAPGATKVLFAICRFTYGWGKKSDRISLKQLSEMTGIKDRGNVYRAIKQLGNLVMIKAGDPSLNQASEYALNIEIPDSDLLSLQQQDLLLLGQQPVVRPVVKTPPIQRNPKKEEIAANKKNSNQPDPDVNHFKKFWAAEYSTRFATPYNFDHGKDGLLIKTLLSTYELPALQELAVRFFNSDDEWIVTKGGFTLAVFKSRINKLNSTGRLQTRAARGTQEIPPP